MAISTRQVWPTRYSLNLETILQNDDVTKATVPAPYMASPFRYRRDFKVTNNTYKRQSAQNSGGRTYIVRVPTGLLIYMSKLQPRKKNTDFSTLYFPAPKASKINHKNCCLTCCVTVMKRIRVTFYLSYPISQSPPTAEPNKPHPPPSRRLQRFAHAESRPRRRRPRLLQLGLQ